VKILIIGGNRFFGKKLALILVSKGHDVSLLNRGSLCDGIEGITSRYKADRNNIKTLEKLIGGQSWDIVYDQVCYDFKEAKAACEFFNGKTKKYIFTSSQSVYEQGEKLQEEDYRSQSHQIKIMENKDSNYAESKRQAEKAFFEFATFPVVAVRFPIVLGSDDYTKRLQFHIDRIINREPLYFPNSSAKISFINSDDAAKSLAFLAGTSFSGPLNAASIEPVSLSDFIQAIEKSLGKKAILNQDYDEKNHSPYGIQNHWYMDCSKLVSLGFSPEPISNWLPKIIK
jgi:nucleoside-diphosphate-sugar epimerase